MHGTDAISADRCANRINENVDFKVSRIQERDWEIVPLSKQGLIWAKANFATETLAAEQPAIRTSPMGANDFLRKARAHGYRTQYAGPSLTTIF